MPFDQDEKMNQKTIARPGTRLEEVVARIQQMMDPNSIVTHNEMLEDRVGNKRQYDVVIRGHFGGRPVLGIVECKDHNRKKGPDAVEAFAKKTDNLGANLRIMVTKKGFTKQALQLAKHENIGCLSLLPTPTEKIGFSIGDMWYGIISKWTSVRLEIHFAMPSIPLPTFDINTVKWNEKRVSMWFLKELFTTYGSETKTGQLTLNLTFIEPRNLEIEGNEYLVAGISCHAIRIYQKKRKWVSWSGDAFYDWHAGQLKIPANGTVVGSSIETDLTNWPDYEGDIPQGDSYKGLMRAIVHDSQKWNPAEDSDVPDLASLCQCS